MSVTILYAWAECDYYIVIDKKNNTSKFYDGKQFNIFEQENKQYLKNSNTIELSLYVFKEYARMNDIEIDPEIEDMEDFSCQRYYYIQNESNDKLIVDEFRQKYMLKKFVSPTNEIDYIKTSNSVFKDIIKALNTNDYDLIEYNDDYFITKEEIFDNFENIINEYTYEDSCMIERYDYFNINVVTNVFKRYFNNKVTDEYFNKFCYLLFILTKYPPIKISKEKRYFYNMLHNLFKRLSYGEINGSKRDISYVYANIKFNYNRLNNIISKKEVKIYYSRGFLSGKEDNMIFPVVIDDKVSKRYWLGYICNPIFDFDVNYISVESENIFSKKLFNIYEDDYEYGLFSEYESLQNKSLFEEYMPHVYNTDYIFDEKLKEKYFL